MRMAVNLPGVTGGGTCDNFDKFCTGSAITFPAGVNQASAHSTAAGNNYGCLSTTPNPAWYYMEIEQPGNLTIDITNSVGQQQDLDFAIWGPFNDLNDAMSNCGNLSLSSLHDCSYSANAYPEQVSITGASSGDVFIILITNYSNNPCDISFTNVGGTATTNCDIESLTAQIGYSNSNTNPAYWTNWTTANQNSIMTGVNDEYLGTLSGLNAGTYYYNFRYSANICPYEYGGYSSTGGGFWDGTNNVNGELTVGFHLAIHLLNTLNATLILMLI